MLRNRYRYASALLAKEAQRSHQKQNLQRNRAYVIRAKSRPCVDCHVQYNPWIMQFDHREPSQKRFEMSELRHNYSLKKLQSEIDKCDVVCANCHQDRTYRYQSWLTHRKLKVHRDDPQGTLFA